MMRCYLAVPVDWDEEKVDQFVSPALVALRRMSIFPFTREHVTEYLIPDSPDDAKDMRLAATLATICLEADAFIQQPCADFCPTCRIEMNTAQSCRIPIFEGVGVKQLRRTHVIQDYVEGRRLIKDETFGQWVDREERYRRSGKRDPLPSRNRTGRPTMDANSESELTPYDEDHWVVWSPVWGR